MKQWTHLDESGSSRMVDVGDKPVTSRRAVASAQLILAAETLEMIETNRHAKGQVLEVARLAGIMAAKRTSELIPLCHGLPLDGVQVDFQLLPPTHLRIRATVQVEAKTGVEMEAMTAASVAALTIYDMCKAVDREMVIERVRLEEKSGGRGGSFKRTD